MEGIGAKLKAARKRQKLTQVQLGRALGVSGPMVSMIEDSDKAAPAELVPMLRRFISSGRLPTSDELAARRQANPGK